jgi:hypothetical protein
MTGRTELGTPGYTPAGGPEQPHRGGFLGAIQQWGHRFSLGKQQGREIELTTISQNLPEDTPERPTSEAPPIEEHRTVTSGSRIPPKARELAKKIGDAASRFFHWITGRSRSRSTAEEESRVPEESDLSPGEARLKREGQKRADVAVETVRQELTTEKLTTGEITPQTLHNALTTLRQAGVSPQKAKELLAQFGITQKSHLVAGIKVSFPEIHEKLRVTQRKLLELFVAKKKEEKDLQAESTQIASEIQKKTKALADKGMPTTRAGLSSEIFKCMDDQKKREREIREEHKGATEAEIQDLLGSDSEIQRIEEAMQGPQGRVRAMEERAKAEGREPTDVEMQTYQKDLEALAKMEKTRSAREKQIREEHRGATEAEIQDLLGSDSQIQGIEARRNTLEVEVFNEVVAIGELEENLGECRTKKEVLENELKALQEAQLTLNGLSVSFRDAEKEGRDPLASYKEVQGALLAAAAEYAKVYTEGTPPLETLYNEMTPIEEREQILETHGPFIDEIFQAEQELPEEAKIFEAAKKKWETSTPEDRRAILQALFQDNVPTDKIRKFLMSVGIYTPQDLREAVKDQAHEQELFPKDIQMGLESSAPLTFVINTLLENPKLSDTTIKQFLRSKGIHTKFDYQNQGTLTPLQGKASERMKKILTEMTEENLLAPARAKWTEHSEPETLVFSHRREILDSFTTNGVNPDVVKEFLRSVGINNQEQLRDALGDETFTTYQTFIDQVFPPLREPDLRVAEEPALVREVAGLRRAFPSEQIEQNKKESTDAWESESATPFDRATALTNLIDTFREITFASELLASRAPPIEDIDALKAALGNDHQAFQLLEDSLREIHKTPQDLFPSSARAEASVEVEAEPRSFFSGLRQRLGLERRAELRAEPQAPEVSAEEQERKAQEAMQELQTTWDSASDSDKVTVLIDFVEKHKDKSIPILISFLIGKGIVSEEALQDYFIGDGEELNLLKSSMSKRGRVNPASFFTVDLPDAAEAARATSTLGTPPKSPIKNASEAWRARRISEAITTLFASTKSESSVLTFLGSRGINSREALEKALGGKEELESLSKTLGGAVNFDKLNQTPLQIAADTWNKGQKSKAITTLYESTRSESSVLTFLLSRGINTKKDLEKELGGEDALRSLEGTLNGKVNFIKLSPNPQREARETWTSGDKFRAIETLYTITENAKTVIDFLKLMGIKSKEGLERALGGKEELESLKRRLGGKVDFDALPSEPPSVPPPSAREAPPKPARLPPPPPGMAPSPPIIGRPLPGTEPKPLPVSPTSRYAPPPPPPLTSRPPAPPPPKEPVVAAPPERDGTAAALKVASDAWGSGNKATLIKDLYAATKDENSVLSFLRERGIKSEKELEGVLGDLDLLMLETELAGNVNFKKL